jgi:cbb3-type cytochrome oxidase maturation protein
MLVTLALFAAGIALGIAGALAWAWGVHSGQLRDLERTKEQLFWPELAPPDGVDEPTPRESR